MSDKSVRQIAWELIFEVEVNGSYSNLELPRVLRNTNFDKRDRGFVTEIVYGSLRMRGYADAAIRVHADRPLERMDIKTIICLRMGAYQLLIMKLPPHAAVSETVELAKQVSGKAAATFVNAVMRRISENLDYVPDELAERYSHPQWIISALKDSLKSDDLVIKQLESDNSPTFPTLIAWPGRSTHEELINDGAIHLEGSRNAFKYDGNPGEIKAIRERRAGVQDLGSQIVVERFFSSGEPGMRWLDLCAGPGGKAAYLDCLIEDGEFVANELSSERARLTSQVVSRGKVVNFDGRHLPDEVGRFDRILIDAPCTGIGALRRRPEVRWRRSPQDLRSLSQLQSELLEASLKHLKSGGVIGYATCSPHLGETKFQISDFLRRHPEVTRIRQEGSSDPDGDLQLWTYRDGTDSMFLSLLRYDR